MRIIAFFLIALNIPAALADDHFAGLPEAPGREEVFIYCASCHSLKLVAQQGMSRAGWEDILVWMYDEQGMEPMPSDDEALVLKYLTDHVSPESQKDRLRAQGILE